MKGASPLSHDYIELLAQQLKRLVVNQKFLKVYDPKTKAFGGKGTILNPDGGLIWALASHDATLFSARRIAIS